MKRLAAVLFLALVSTLPASAQRVKLPRATAPLILVDLAKPEAVARWSGLKCDTVAVGGGSGMRFTFPKFEPGANEWPAIYLAYEGGKGYPLLDWSHYGSIAFDAWVTGDKAGDVALELRDHKGSNGWAAHLPLEAGKANHITVPLPDVATEVSLEHVEEIVFFTTRPPREYTVTLANLRLLPGDRPPLAEFDLLYPNYRGLIFPGVDRVRLSARLHPEEYNRRPEDLTLVVTCKSGRKSVSARSAFAKGAASVSLPTSALPAGPATLTATVLGKSGERPAERAWPLRKLTAGEVKDLKVYLDADNNTIVEGKPFFPLGFYGSGSESQAREIADSPFNCLLDYGTNSKPKAEMLKYLDLLQAKGLKLIYCLNDVYPTATYYSGKSWEGVTGNQEMADAVVRAYRDHPAMLAWYLNDELPKGLVPKLTDYYGRVAGLDPNHPCYIVLCNMSELSYFTETTDVMGVDPYPIPQSPVTRVSDWMELANQATRGRQATWLVPQAFAWYQHHPTGSDRARVPTEGDLRTGRAPTYEEGRCMTYLALAHGAKGLIYWCYYNMRVLPQYQEMWGWMKRLGAEVKTLSPVLLTTEPGEPVRFRPENAPIHTRLLRHEGRRYLLAVSAGREPCQVIFAFPRALPAQVDVLFEDRKAPTEGAKLPASFKPLEVHVYDLGR